MKVCTKALELLETIKYQQTRELDEFGEFLQSLESPIEQILLAAMRKRWSCKFTGHGVTGNLPFGDVGSLGLTGMFSVDVSSQEKIKTKGGKRYRPDFLIRVYRFRSSLTEQDDMDLIEMTRMVVETDGHAFHEKTPQQASLDRRRDRELLLEGYFVLRFTGADVYNDPDRCVEEIEIQLQKLAVDALKNAIENGKLKDFILLDPEEYRK